MSHRIRFRTARSRQNQPVLCAECWRWKVLLSCFRCKKPICVRCSVKECEARG